MADNMQTTEYAVKFTADMSDLDKGFDDAAKKAKDFSKKLSSSFNPTDFKQLASDLMKAADASKQMMNSMNTSRQAKDLQEQRKAIADIQRQYQAMYNSVTRAGKQLETFGKSLAGASKAVAQQKPEATTESWEQQTKALEAFNLATQDIKTNSFEELEAIYDRLLERMDELNLKAIEFDPDLKDAEEPWKALPDALQNEYVQIQDALDNLEERMESFGKSTAAADMATGVTETVKTEFQSAGDAAQGAMQSAVNAAESLTTSAADEFENIGQSAGEATEEVAEQSERRIVSLKDRIKDAGTAVADFAKRITSAFKTAETEDIEETFDMSDVREDFEAVRSDIEATTQKLEGFYDKARKMKATGTDPGSSSWRNLQYDIRNAEASLRSYNAELRSLKPGAIADLEQEIENIEQQMRELGEQRFETDEFKQISTDAQKAEEALLKLYTRQEKMENAGVKESSSAWKNLQYDIETAERKLAMYENAQERMKTDGTAWTPGTDTTEYSDLQSRLEESRALLEQYSAEGSSRFKDMFSSVGRFAGNAARTAASAFGSVLVAGIRKVGDGFKKAVSGIKSFVKHIKDARKHAESTTAVIRKAYSVFTSFGRMLMTRIKRTFISAVFNDMKENFGSIAGISDRFNGAVSGIVNSCKQLGAQLIAAVEPIVVAVAPYIQKFIDLLSEGADKVAQFAARLTGNDTYLKASKGQYDYAKSLDKTTNSTQKAEKAAKKYQATVLGFDQLNKLNGSDDDASTDITDDTDATKAQLEKAETKATALNALADKIRKSFGKIKDAIKAGDFKGAGKLVGQGINEAFKWIKDIAGWEANSEKLTGILRNAIDFINGISDGFDGTVVGDAIGDVINTIVESLVMLTDPETGIDFYKIGSNIGTTIKTMFETIKWEDVGRGIVQAFQGLIQFINGIIGTEGFWASLGDAVSEGIKGAVDAFRPEDWAEFVDNLINGLFEFLEHAFSDHESLEKLGAKFAQFISDALDGIEWETVEKGLENFGKGMVDIVAGFIEDAEWEKIAKSALNGLISLIEAAANTIIYGANKIMEAIFGTREEAYAARVEDGYVGGRRSGSGKSWLTGNKHEWFEEVRLPKLAGGGIVGDGQLFIANEGGRAELIGDDGNGNTAVVNNEQIISAVVSGVRQGMMDVMMMFNDGNGSGDGGDLILMVDSEELARASMRGQRKIEKRVNPSVSFA